MRIASPAFSRARLPLMMVAACLLSGAIAGTASAAGESQGRYTMSPAEGGGFVRLDTQSGQVSLCQRRDTQWSCQDMAEPGRGLSDEIERLRAENKELKSQIRQMEDLVLGDKQGTDKRAERPGGGLGLPSEQDVDKAMSYIQGMLRKFKEKLKEFETENKGTPL